MRKNSTCTRLNVYKNESCEKKEYRKNESSMNDKSGNVGSVNLEYLRD